MGKVLVWQERSDFMKKQLFFLHKLLILRKSFFASHK